MTLPKNALDGLSDVFLNIHCFGDVARLHEGAQLLDDKFFNGSPWEVGLKRFTPQALTEGMELNVLSLCGKMLPSSYQNGPGPNSEQGWRLPM